MVQSYGYAVSSEKTPLTPFAFERRDPGPHDIVMEILYCGICHTDLSSIDNEWGFSLYPMVPGHEIVGRITAIGGSVTKFVVGDIAAIGCIVDSCRVCDPCTHDQENLCREIPTPTYSGYERGTGRMMYGGYSNNYVADEAYVVRLPDGLDLAGAAPLLCAGITTYSPLRHWKVGPGQRIGVVGLGGLGHLAVKIARAMGAEVVLFTSSAAKVADGLALGASKVVLSSDPEQMAGETGNLDFILDTVSAAHDINAYLAFLKIDATLCLLGVPAGLHQISAFSLVGGRKNLTGSLIGGIAETQEVLDFCAKHNITADVELIAIQDVDQALDRLRKSDVKYRFVIDLSSLEAA